MPYSSTRLLLVCAGATMATREACFPRPTDSLDEGGRAKARTLASALPGRAAALRFVSPAAAAIETAALFGIADAETAAALRDADGGDWAGQALSALDPAAVATWLAAPEIGPPGGEGLAAVQERVGPWMDDLAAGRILAITHPAVVRAAIAHALGIAVGTTVAIDLAPLSWVVLSRHGRWRLQEVRAP